MTLKTLLSDSTKWTQGAYARNKHGVSCATYHDNAVSFCLYGGLIQCYLHDKRAWTEAIIALQNALLSMGHQDRSLFAFNDAPTTTFEDIQTLIQLANV